MADELELLEGLVKDFGEQKKKTAEQLQVVTKEVTERLDKATADQKADTEKYWKDLTTKVETLNAEMATKGLLITQAQEELKEFKAKAGRSGAGFGDNGEQTTFMLLKEAFAAEFDKIKEQASEPKADHRFKIKTVGTMTAAANLTGSVQASYSNTPAVRGRRKLHFRDLVQVIPSATGLWKFYRQNIPVGEGSFGFQTTHGALKNQVDYDYTEVTITVDYLAGFVRIAKQMLQDLPFMQNYVNTELIEDYLRTEDNAFFGQLYSAATGPNLATGANTAERIINNIAALEENDYEVNGILVSGPVWAGLILTNLGSGAGYGVPGGITITPSGDVAIVGVPIVKTPATNLGSSKVLMGDFTKAAIIQAEGLNVSMSEHDSDNFQRNLVTVKAEARVQLAVLRPDAFSYFASA